MIEKQTIGIDGGTGLPLVRPKNAGAADVLGAELEARVPLGALGLPEATLLANYTRQSAKLKDAATGTRRRLKDHPEDLGNLIARWENRRIGFAASAGLNYVGEAVDETVSPRKVTSPFLQWDASIQQRLGLGISLQASALNLLDEMKVKDDGLRREEERVGRTFYLGLNMEF
ncbi:MAG: TonB-dependent receptor [Elusimicrobia bacterium]|nr:TonB-dependent receptor [Elusimicrobiota bacterium]